MIGQLALLASFLFHTADPPPKITARWAATSCYVGQPVELFVNVTNAPSRPSIEPIAIEGAALIALGSHIQGHQYRESFLVVPTRSGAITAGPFAARVGGLRATGPRISLQARPVPQAGRPSAFLGGVGNFALEASAKPESAMVGDEIEYRVHVQGPGALGITSTPDLGRLKNLVIALELSREPDEVLNEPPGRTLVYRLRPTKPGEVTLPPVVIAAFDPRLKRFITKAAAGIPLTVNPRPRFNPDSIVNDSTPVDEPPKASRVALAWAIGIASMAIGIASILLVMAAAAWWARRARNPDVQARRAVHELRRTNDPEAAARALVRALTAYLSLTMQRPTGALTPDEAREGILLATGSEALAAEAHRVIIACDAVLYGVGSRAINPRDEGIQLFSRLSNSRQSTEKSFHGDSADSWR